MLNCHMTYSKHGPLKYAVLFPEGKHSEKGLCSGSSSHLTKQTWRGWAQTFEFVYNFSPVKTKSIVILYDKYEQNYR